MEIVQVVGLGLVAAILVTFLREHRPELAIQVSLVAGIIIVMMIIQRVALAVNTITEMAIGAGINFLYMQTLLRIIGVAYLAEFGSQVCRDAGEGSLASRIEFAAKILILVMAMPIVIAVMDSILRIIP